MGNQQLRNRVRRQPLSIGALATVLLGLLTAFIYDQLKNPDVLLKVVAVAVLTAASLFLAICMYHFWMRWARLNDLLKLPPVTSTTTGVEYLAKLDSPRTQDNVNSLPAVVRGVWISTIVFVGVLVAFALTFNWIFG